MCIRDSCSSKHGCQGGEMDDAYRYLEATAFCSKQSYDYIGAVGTCKASTCDHVLPKGAIVGITEVAHDERSLMSAVAQQPVSVAVDGAMGDLNAFQLYKGGILNSDCGSKVDHGVLVVGYGTDGEGNDYWKVKNSYGTAWGMKGYALLARGKPGGGECGILTGGMSYPVLR
eukprot:TRINITY_DN9178_c0_g2_i1.p1 TRINITY_DN9178_c0_g2~~TRINITY_DN9178_c0_g2_i1.p1  ORF type:complete len:172 (+),score=32.13 TRINITY_DN9178_c0_g2_i1:47-562(+)